MFKTITAFSCLIWSALAFGQDLEIYVSDAGEFDQGPWTIFKYDADGQNPEAFISTGLAWPQDILFLENEGAVLISKLITGRISRYDAETGAFINEFATGIAQPTRIKIGPDGLLYVLQWQGSGLVKRYQLDGTPLGDFTDVGVIESIGLDWDTDGNLYVSSFSGASVRKFSPSGEDMGLFINSNLQGPTNIYFDEQGDLLVLDWRGTSVRRFDSNGNFQGDFLTGLSQAEGVDFMPNGNILIGNGGTGAVKMFQPDGTYVTDLVPSGSGGLIRPNAVVIRQPETVFFSLNPGLNDAWFNPATPGQGFFVTVFPDVRGVFLAWFTYDTERPDASISANLGEPGHRWLTAFGTYDRATAVLDVELTNGGLFNAAMPVPSQQVDGEIVLEFAGCNEAILSYHLPSVGLQGEIPIQRIALDNVALCEAATIAPQVIRSE